MEIYNNVVNTCISFVELTEYTQKGVLKGNRQDILHALHESIEFIFQPLMKVTIKGIPFQIEDERNLCGHFMISSYVPNIPKADNTLSVKGNKKESSPFHGC